MDEKKFLALLKHRREELLDVMASGNQAAKTVELDQTRVGRLSRMDAMQAQAMSQETNRRGERELIRIAGALKRLEAGEYGLCVECDEEIAEKRLEVDLTADLCIDCARKKELQVP